MQLTYLQARNIKEKVNKHIYGEPKYYYKLSPWVSIQGFAMGCWPIIAIDSAHMSGPYKGALFSVSAYNANDSMFPLAFGVMSS